MANPRTPSDVPRRPGEAGTADRGPGYVAGSERPIGASSGAGAARSTAGSDTSGMSTYSRNASQGGARIEGGSEFESNDGPGPQLMTAGTLSGDKVMNRAGETLGEISDIMLDVPRGRIAYAVMSSGGFLGIGEKLFAIPWSALALDTDNHCFVLDVAKERMEQAPGFDKDRWPSMADMSWSTDVHTYYRARPYWE
jgi:sporulation protein YlmC with PRC-barrel domain